MNYAPGCADAKCETTDRFSDAVQIAKSADYVIMVMGLDKTVEAEGRDRVHIPCSGAVYDVLEPPGCQNALVQLISELNSNIVIVYTDQWWPSESVTDLPKQSSGWNR